MSPSPGRHSEVTSPGQVTGPKLELELELVPPLPQRCSGPRLQTLLEHGLGHTLGHHLPARASGPYLDFLPEMSAALGEE